MSVTVIHPANDASALELSNWCRNLLSYINGGPGLGANRYAGSADRTSIGGALRNAQAVLFYGHGSDAELLGASWPIIDAENIGLAAGSIFVAIACSSAKVLGPTSVKRGVTAYLGFRDRFVWVSRDPDDGCFEEAINSGVSKLIDGGTAADALDSMSSALGDIVEYYLNGEGKKSPNRAIGWLAAYWDQQHIELHGLNTARLSDSHTVRT